GAGQYLSGAQVVRHVVDAVAHGGRVLLNGGPRADGSLHPLQVRALETLGACTAERTTPRAGARGLGPLENAGAHCARAGGKDGRCHVHVSGEQGALRIAAADLPPGYDWPAEGVEVVLGGTDALPTVVTALER